MAMKTFSAKTSPRLSTMVTMVNIGFIWGAKEKMMMLMMTKKDNEDDGYDEDGRFSPLYQHHGDSKGESEEGREEKTPIFPVLLFTWCVGQNYIVKGFLGLNAYFMELMIIAGADRKRENMKTCLLPKYFLWYSQSLSLWFQSSFWNMSNILIFLYIIKHQKNRFVSVNHTFLPKGRWPYLSFGGPDVGRASMIQRKARVRIQKRQK